MTDAPEWNTATDWSNLPDVYVTKAECQHGMFWRIEACSVPMVIGPEVRLIRTDLIPALIADAVAKERERCAHVAEREGVYPELNIYAGGPEWYQHGKRIAAAIRAGKGE